eukprot:scaffold418779_cov40-Prasinocladus_malaysianus.AAC.1
MRDQQMQDFLLALWVGLCMGMQQSSHRKLSLHTCCTIHEYCAKYAHSYHSDVKARRWLQQLNQHGKAKLPSGLFLGYHILFSRVLHTVVRDYRFGVQDGKRQNLPSRHGTAQSSNHTVSST